MIEKLINVSLHGGKSGGREEPLKAILVHCSMCDQCTYYKSGHCFALPTLFGKDCKHAKRQVIKGYTSRAKKYKEFKEQWRNHEKYNALTYPPKKLGVIGDEVVFPYPYVRIVFDEDNGEWRPKDPNFLIDELTFIPYRYFTTELIYRICKFRPRSLFGEITNYQKEVVPIFLAHLKEVLPERYKEFVEEYGHLDERFVNIDYVGRKALLKTINPSIIQYKSKDYHELNSEWYWDGQYIIYVGGYVGKFNVVDSYEIDEIRLKPKDNTVVTITDNKQVNENTVFVD